MALTHVCIWENRKGYRRVTVEEASDLYPDTVHAESGIFVCELCAQNVSFSAPGEHTRHFRHSRGDEDKNCEERQNTVDNELNSLNNHSMPIRIRIEENVFRLEIGFFAIDQETIMKSEGGRIQIVGSDHQKFEYSLERMNPFGMTYLNVGETPCSKYRIMYQNLSEDIKDLWPSSLKGLNRLGTFFEVNSGKMVEVGGRAYIENEYYLLQQEPLEYFQGIQIQEINSEQRHGITKQILKLWYLYKIKIEEYSKEIARFFLERSVFLTDKPIKFYPIWPVCIQSPHLVYHNDNHIYFFMSGDRVELKTFPRSEAKYLVVGEDKGEGKLIKVPTLDRQQLLALGNLGAMGFSYLIKKELIMEAKKPSILIKDSENHQLDLEIYKKIPNKKRITIKAPFDGKVLILRKDQVAQVIFLSSEQELTLEHLSFDIEIKIFQGCDCVRKIQFIKKRKFQDFLIADEELVRKLKANDRIRVVCVGHALGALAERYEDYPQTKRWIYQKIRQGEISTKAYRLLLQYFIMDGRR